MKSKLIVPTTLDEIPLLQMQEYQSLSQEMDELERIINALSIFCNIPIGEVRNIPIDAIVQATEIIQKTLSQKPEHKATFELNGIKYGFIPNIDEITTGEFIDIESYSKNQEIYKVMSVLYRPIIIEGQRGRYEIQPYDGKINEDFREMPSGVAYGAMLFFWTLGIDLLSYMKRFLEGMPKEQAMNIPLTKNGVGLALSIYSLEEILLNLTLLRDTPFTKLCYGLPTKQIWQNWKRKQSKKHIENEQ